MGSSYSPPAADPTAATPFTDEVIQEAVFAESGSTPVLATGMTLTPSAGTYLVFFGGTVEGASGGETPEISIFAGGVVVGETVRYLGILAPSAGAQLHIVGVATVNGSQAIEGRLANQGGGTDAQIYNRSLQILRVS